MDLPVGFLSTSYQTDQGDSLTLYRPITIAEFPTVGGRSISRRCLIDTCAPLSIVPYAVWHARKLKWFSVSKTLHGLGGSAALTWQGVPCELGKIDIELAGPRKLVAKFALQPTAPLDVILGLNFLVDNDLELVLGATRGSPSAKLVVP